ncbi:MAG: ABC transporter ATP-binding protein [Syntrophomonadaceae bacterium]|jgi:branched-chain amino acid transport system ATP-binding protein|nr:ABC transporter ATP-binding protein [Syntrophomonadaceae bacterium]
MKPILEVKKVSKLFGGLPAVNNVSFDLAENEILGLIGPNGAGKTTLFNLISGYHEISKGDILYRGHKISGFLPEQVCSQGIVRTFQVVKPFGEMTVEENVMVGAFCRTADPNRARVKAQETINFVGLDKYAAMQARNLTIADRKRLEFARALATEPKILMLDEVMAGLRPNEVDDSLELIRKVRASGITIIIVEHIMRAIMTICERILVLDHGELIAEGTPQEVTSNKKVIEAYLGKEESADV